MIRLRSALLLLVSAQLSRLDGIGQVSFAEQRRFHLFDQQYRSEMIECTRLSPAVRT
jgi:hypothetical protein